MIKVAIIGVMAALLVIPLKREKGEIGLLVILAACLLILSLSLDRIREILDGVRTMKNLLGKGSVYIGILLKMIGITYVAEFSSNLCADAGYHAVADQIEFYGKIMIMAVSLPILLNLVDTIATI